MKTYRVVVKEVYYNTYEVEAMSERHAQRGAKEGKGVMVDDALEFSHTIETGWEDWEVSEAPVSDEDGDGDFETDNDREIGLGLELTDLVDIQFSRDGKQWDFWMTCTYDEWERDTMHTYNQGYPHARVIRHDPNVIWK